MKTRAIFVTLNERDKNGNGKAQIPIYTTGDCQLMCKRLQSLVKQYPDPETLSVPGKIFQELAVNITIIIDAIHDAKANILRLENGRPLSTPTEELKDLPGFQELEEAAQTEKDWLAHQTTTKSNLVYDELIRKREQLKMESRNVQRELKKLMHA